MSKQGIILLSSFFLVFLVSEGSTPAWAQAVAGAQIRGVITDSTGAVVPHAAISAIQTSTGVVHTTVSNDSGSYVLVDLPLGPYRVEVGASGFKKYIQSGIELHVSDNVEINVGLQVGGVAQTVEVKSNTELVQTSNVSVSQVVNQAQMVDLPLNGRNPTQLVVLSGGTATVTSGGVKMDFYPSGGLGKQYPTEVPMSVAGGQANGSNWLLDGADNNDAFVNVNLPYPFPDALQEFNVETSARSARTGVHAGSVVNVVTKAGTNQIHGDLFEFVRNGDLNARNFFAATQDTLKRNQFGGTVGGPIKRDKLFFFSGYQGTRQRSTAPGNIAFGPTAAVLNGDFSALDSAACQSSGVGKQLVNPSTGQPFANNFISPTLFNSSALALLKYIPVSTNSCGELIYSLPQTGDENQILGRIDWVHSAKHTLFGRYFLADWSNPVLFDGADFLPSQRQGLVDLNQALTLGETYTVSSSIVNSLHFAASRLRIKRGPPTNYFTPATLGINLGSGSGGYFPAITVSSYFTTSTPNATLRPVNDTFQVADDLDMIRGRHHLSLGFEYFRNRLDYTKASGMTDSFNGSLTKDALADFMLGDLATFTQAAPVQDYSRQNIWGFYGEDVFHINSHFTLTAGLRWEPYLPIHDEFGRGSHFDFAAFAAGTKTSAFTNAPPGLLYNTDPGIPHAYTNGHLLNVEPRLGIVWDPTGKGTQTLRISYGIFYDQEISYYNDHLFQSPPWSPTVALTDPPGGLSNPWAGITGGNPFPFPITPASNFPWPLEGVYVNLPPLQRPTYVQQYNLSYQRQLGKDWLVSATYLGNKTTHLWTSTEIDPAVYIPGTCSGKACSTTANTNQRRVLYLENAATGAYYSTIGQTDDGANAEYNGLMLSVQHRFDQKFTMLSNYTYSHCISVADFAGELQGPIYQNPYNREGDRGNCTFDYRHIFNTSLVASSPNFQQPWEHRLLSNWQLSPIISARSGQWFTPMTGVDNSLTGVGLDRPTVVQSNPYPSQKSIARWVNPSAFTANALGTFGDAGRDSLLGPRSVEFDLAVVRQFPIREQKKFEFRFEAFNIINHPNFVTPTATLSSAQFGEILSAADPRILQLALKFWF